MENEFDNINSIENKNDQAPSREPQQTQKLNKKQIAILTIGILIAILALTAAAIFIGRLSEDKPEDIAPESTQATTTKTTYYSVGETATYDDLEITIDSFSYQQGFCGIEIPSSNDNTLCIIEVTLHNPTNTRKSLQTGTYIKNGVYIYNFLYDGKISYSGIFKSYSDFLLAHQSIDPLETITASLCFEIPNTVKNSKKSIELEFSLNKLSIATYLQLILKYYIS